MRLPPGFREVFSCKGVDGREIGSVSARGIADRLGRSTQPVLHHFTHVGAQRGGLFQRREPFRFLHPPFTALCYPPNAPYAGVRRILFLRDGHKYAIV